MLRRIVGGSPDLQRLFQRFSFPRFRFFFPTRAWRVFTHRSSKLFGLPRRSLTKAGVFIASAVALTTGSLFAGTTTYTIQTGNFTTTKNVASSGGFAGEFNNSATEVGFFANQGSGQDDASAFQTLSTSGVGSGTITARTLQVGDSFSITMFSASNPFGFEGAYFDDNTTYTTFSNYNTNERTAVVLGSSGNWIIENNGTSVDTGIAANNSVTAVLTVTSSNTFNMAITNNTNSATTTYYDLVMKNAPGTTARIQSFSLIDQNDRQQNFFVKNGSLTNTGSVTIGGSNLSLTVSGVITDGLDSASTTTNSVNTLTKIGTGTMSLTGANSYTGLTTISVGTLNIQNNTALGTTAAGTSVTNGAALELQGGITVGAEALALNGSGVSGNGALRNVSGANTYGGLITLGSASTITSNTAGGSDQLTLTGGIALGANRVTVNGAGDTIVSTTGITGINGGDILKQGTGTLNLNVASSFVGSGTGNANAAFIDQGTISVGATGALGTTDGATTGLVNMGSAGTGGLNTALNISSSSVTLANPVLIRYLQTGGKTLSGTFTSSSSTFSGAISLADHLTIAAANGGTLLFTGVISQAAGTGSNTPGVGLVNNTSPTGGFSTNGPGVIINSGASSTGIVEYDNAMTYQGDTVVNSGTLQFNGSGSLANSSIRLGNLGAATINMSATGGTSLPVTINVRPSTGTKTISAANTSGTATLGGHFALDDDATVTETSSTGTLAITRGRSSATDTLTGTDIKNHTLTFSGAGTINVGATSPTGFGTIYNSGTGNNGNVVMSGSGTLSFTDKNTYSGTTTINSGTLSAVAASALGSTSGITVNSTGTLLLSGSSGVTDRINDTATVTLNGGKFNTGGLSEGTTGTAGVGALTLQNNSIIDLGSGTSILHFAASNAATWTASKILEIDNWSGTQSGGGTDQLIFGTTSGGLTGSQIAEIQFLNPGGFSAGTYGAAILANGEIVPIPESSTWVAGALAFIGLFATQRRRLARIMRAENRARTLPDNL